MNLSDVEQVCRMTPYAMVIASHLDSVNHALVTREDVKEYAERKKLLQIRVPDDGDSIIV